MINSKENRIIKYKFLQLYHSGQHMYGTYLLLCTRDRRSLVFVFCLLYIHTYRYPTLPMQSTYHTYLIAPRGGLPYCRMNLTIWPPLLLKKYRGHTLCFRSSFFAFLNSTEFLFQKIMCPLTQIQIFTEIWPVAFFPDLVNT